MNGHLQNQFEYIRHAEEKQTTSDVDLQANASQGIDDTDYSLMFAQAGQNEPTYSHESHSHCLQESLQPQTRWLKAKAKLSNLTQQFKSKIKPSLTERPEPYARVIPNVITDQPKPYTDISVIQNVPPPHNPQFYKRHNRNLSDVSTISNCSSNTSGYFSTGEELCSNRDTFDIDSFLLDLMESPTNADISVIQNVPPPHNPQFYKRHNRNLSDVSSISNCSSNASGYFSTGEELCSNKDTFDIDSFLSDLMESPTNADITDPSAEESRNHFTSMSSANSFYGIDTVCPKNDFVYDGLVADLNDPKVELTELEVISQLLTSDNINTAVKSHIGMSKVALNETVQNCLTTREVHGEEGVAATNNATDVVSTCGQNQAQCDFISEENISVMEGNGRKHRVVEKKYRERLNFIREELRVLLNVSNKGRKETIYNITEAAVEEIQNLRKAVVELSSEVKKLKEAKMTQKNEVDLVDNQLLDLSPNSNAARQSARDGVKTMTFVLLFLFCFVNPTVLIKGKSTAFEADHSFHSSRHLLSDNDMQASNDNSPSLLASSGSLSSQILRIVVSLLILMLTLLRGNVRFNNSLRISQSFHRQISTADRILKYARNKYDFERAKSIYRSALLVIGDKCPTTTLGYTSSYIWKALSHLLYKTNSLKLLETIGRLILPSGLLYPDEKDERKNAAKLLVKAYIKLHECALKDPCCGSLEANCYILNAIHVAEVSANNALLSRVYTQAAIHVKEKAWFMSKTMQNYFLRLSESAQPAGEEMEHDWMFHGVGYEFFVEGDWSIKTDGGDTFRKGDIIELLSVKYLEKLIAQALNDMLSYNENPKFKRFYVETSESYLSKLRRFCYSRSAFLQTNASVWVNFITIATYILKQTNGSSLSWRINTTSELENSGCKYAKVMRSLFKVWKLALSLRQVGEKNPNCDALFNFAEEEQKKCLEAIQNLCDIGQATKCSKEIADSFTVVCCLLLMEAKILCLETARSSRFQAVVNTDCENMILQHVNRYPWLKNKVGEVQSKIEQYCHEF